MRHIPVFTSLLLLTVSLSSALAFQGGKDVGGGPSPRWTTTLESKADELECLDASAAGSTTWLLVAARDKGKLAGLPVRYRISALDAGGGVPFNLELGSLGLDDSPSQRVRRVFGIAALSDTTAAVLGELEPGRLVLGVAKQGGPSQLFSLKGKTDPDLLITRVFAGQGRVLAVGRAGARAIVLTVDPQSRSFDSIVVDDTEPAVLYDRVQMSDGSLFVVGGAIDPKGGTRVWVGKLDSHGKLLAKHSFPGRSPRVWLTDGGVVVTYLSIGEGLARVAVRTYRDDLSESGSAQFPLHVGKLLVFDIAPAGVGEFRFVGEGDDREHTPRLSGLERSGRATWSQKLSIPGVSLPLLYNARLLVYDGRWSAVMTVLGVDQAGEQRQIIRVADYSR